MKSFFEEIFKYQNAVNQDILVQLAEIDAEFPPKVLDLLSHSINAHKLWNNRILGKSDKVLFETLTINELIRLDIQNYNDTLQIILNKFFNERIHYNSLSGKAYENTVQEILIQVSQHYQYHRGQIIAELLKQGIRLNPTDYIYFSRREA